MDRLFNNSTVSDDLKTFSGCFRDFVPKNPAAQSLRKDTWRACDPNGNGIVSLAEMDGWIKKHLVNKLHNDEGERLWHKYRPCFIRAFNDAKDIGTEVKLKGASGTTEDYVEFNEFRLMCAYVCIYAAMYDAFTLIDGSVTHQDDRRISLDEWLAGCQKLRGTGFVGFSNINNPTAAFHEMDADHKGMVLLTEWCEWLEKKEQAAKTEVGEMLAAGDN